MHEPAHAGVAARGSDGLRQLDVEAREIRAVVVWTAVIAPPAPALQHADEVIHGLLAGAQPLEHPGRHDVGLYHVDCGQQDEMLARSRRREGTLTSSPAEASEATRCRPMKPNPHDEYLARLHGAASAGFFLEHRGSQAPGGWITPSRVLSGTGFLSSTAA